MKIETKFKLGDRVKIYREFPDEDVFGTIIGIKIFLYDEIEYIVELDDNLIIEYFENELKKVNF